MTTDSAPGVGELPALHEAWLPREHSLHRPRHGGRQRLALICAVIFFLGPSVLWLGGMRPTQIENRQLAGFPSPARGFGFFTDLSRWSTDNLVFRSQAIDIDQWISETLFGEQAPFDQGGGAPAGPLPGTSPTETGGGSEPEAPTGTDASGFRRVIEGTDGWMYLGYDFVAKCRPLRTVDETIKQLTQLREVVEGSGRQFILLMPPDKTTMVPEHMPQSYPGKDCASGVGPTVWRKATTLAGALDLRPVLHSAAARVGHPVYFPLDSHWTQEGALEMVRVLAERIQPGVSRTWRIEPKNQPTVADADLPPLIGQTGQNTGYRYRLWPDGETERTVPGTADLRTPVHATSSHLPGMVRSKTLLLSDSFGIAASPYLPATFDDVTQLLYSTVKGNPRLVLSTIADTEVVAVQIVERNVAGGFADLLDQKFVDLLRAELPKR